MIRFMLDTNICIYTMKNKPEHVRQRFNQYYGQMAISSVTLMELAYGAEKSQQKSKALAAIEVLSQGLLVLEFDDQAAYHAGEIRASLALQGMPIGGYDVMIAGHARSQGLIVVTNNGREFERVEGLRVENWVDNQG